MYIKKGKGPTFVTLKDGSKMCRADLPPPQTRRWVASRKGRVVQAVEAGLLPAEEACTVYGLSCEELESWRGLAKTHGEGALRATAVQKIDNPRLYC